MIGKFVQIGVKRFGKEVVKKRSEPVQKKEVFP